MHATHSGFAQVSVHFFLNGQKTHPISSIEGSDAEKLITFTSLLDFAGPCARLFSVQRILLDRNCWQPIVCVQLNGAAKHRPYKQDLPFPHTRNPVKHARLKGDEHARASHH